MRQYLELSNIQNYYFDIIYLAMEKSALNLTFDEYISLVRYYVG